MSEEYTLITIQTEKNIKSLCKLLNSLTDENNQIVVIVKDFYRDPSTKVYYENGLKIALVHNRLIEKIKNTDLVFNIYEFTRDQLPNPKNSVPHYFFPNSNESKDYKNANKMEEKLTLFQQFGILPKNSWRINKDKGICEFNRKVSIETRLMIKIILDNPFMFRVSWCRKRLFDELYTTR